VHNKEIVFIKSKNDKYFETNGGNYQGSFYIISGLFSVFQESSPDLRPVSVEVYKEFIQH
jgi:hypothetical protein